MLLLSILTASVILNCHTRGLTPQWALWWAKEGSNTKNIYPSCCHIYPNMFTTATLIITYICGTSHQSHLQYRHKYTGWSVGYSVHFHFYFHWCSQYVFVWTLCICAGQDTTTAHLQNIKYFIPYITSRVVCHILLTQFKRDSEVRSHDHVVCNESSTSPIPYNVSWKRY